MLQTVHRHQCLKCRIESTSQSHLRKCPGDVDRVKEKNKRNTCSQIWDQPLHLGGCGCSHGKLEKIKWRWQHFGLINKRFFFVKWLFVVSVWKSEQYYCLVLYWVVDKCGCMQLDQQPCRCIFWCTQLVWVKTGWEGNPKFHMLCLHNKVEKCSREYSLFLYFLKKKSKNAKIFKQIHDIMIFI